MWQITYQHPVLQNTFTLCGALNGSQMLVRLLEDAPPNDQAGPSKVNVRVRTVTSQCMPLGLPVSTGTANHGPRSRLGAV